MNTRPSATRRTPKRESGIEETVTGWGPIPGRLGNRLPHDFPRALIREAMEKPSRKQAIGAVCTHRPRTGDRMGIHFTSLAEKADPKHSALIVVDVQNDFCAPDGECARRGRDTTMMLDMSPRLAKLIRVARDQGVLIVFLRGVEGKGQVLSDAWSELVTLRTAPSQRLLCQDGARGADFFPPVVPSGKDVVITKYRYSGFAGTNLDQILRSNNILTVIVTGVVTEVCVEATVRSACDLDYRVVIVDDCTATWSQQAQESALQRMAGICADRATSDMLLQTWK